MRWQGVGLILSGLATTFMLGRWSVSGVGVGGDCPPLQPSTLQEPRREIRVAQPPRPMTQPSAQARSQSVFDQEELALALRVQEALLVGAPMAWTERRRLEVGPETLMALFKECANLDSDDFSLNCDEFPCIGSWSHPETEDGIERCSSGIGGSTFRKWGTNLDDPDGGSVYWRDFPGVLQTEDEVEAIRRRTRHRVEELERALDQPL